MGRRPPGSWGVGGMSMVCCFTVGVGGGGIGKLNVVPGLLAEILLVGRELKVSPNGVAGDTGDAGPSGRVLVLAPRSMPYTESCHNHACHGHTHPSCSHGHVAVSM
jgi:hypothetical protein